MTTRKTLAIGAAGAAAGLVLIATLNKIAPPAPSKAQPVPCGTGPGDPRCPTPATVPTAPSAPTATATVVATLPPAPTTAPTTPTSAIPTPTVATAGTLPPVLGCPVTVAGVLPDPASYSGGKFRTGYADSLAIDGGLLWIRESYGVTAWRLDNLVTPARIFDLEARWPKVGDGFQTVSGIAVSGGILLANWKQDTHGTLILSATSGALRGEFAPPRALGGVAISGGRALALTTGALWSADLVGGSRLAVPGAPGGVERSLTADGSTAAYVTPGGSLVVVVDGIRATTHDVGASAVAIEGAAMLIGVHDGMRRVGPAGLGPVSTLPATPLVVALLGGRAYAFVGSDLYREGTRVLSLDRQLGPPVVARGAGDLLAVGTRDRTVVVRTGC